LKLYRLLKTLFAAEDSWDIRFIELQGALNRFQLEDSCNSFNKAFGDRYYIAIDLERDLIIARVAAAVAELKTTSDKKTSRKAKR
jgi:hypothetical protein